MKNQRFKTKLILNSQTIRRLSTSGLHAVHGGRVPMQSADVNCASAVNCTDTCTELCTIGGCRDCG